MNTRIAQKEVINHLCVFQYLEIECARLLGGWLPGLRRWESKHAAALHLWQDAQHSKHLRTRLWELKVMNPDRLVPDEAKAVISALALAREDDEFLAGLYLGLKSALLAAYHRYIEVTHPVNDAPSVEVIRRIIPELEAQLSAAREMLAMAAPSAPDSDEGRGDRWRRFIASRSAFLGESPGQPAEAVLPPPGYSVSPLPFAEARRDERFKVDFTGIPRPAEGDFEAARLFQFINYAHEMQAAETLGSVLWEAEGMPWEFYFDVARHCYDEARHCQLGETRLAELGRHITEFPHCVTNYNWRQLVDPLRRYCILTYVIEQDSFKYKHESYKRYLERTDHESAEAVLFDIADEMLHVRWGKKWVPELMKNTGEESDLDTLVAESRRLLQEHSVNPMQIACSQRN